MLMYLQGGKRFFNQREINMIKKIVNTIAATAIAGTMGACPMRQCGD